MIAHPDAVDDVRQDSNIEKCSLLPLCFKKKSASLHLNEKRLHDVLNPADVRKEDGTVAR